MAVPEGTVQDVLDWVDGDPGRAQQALDAERAGQNRSTLITQLEATCPKEDSTVSDTDVRDTDTDSDEEQFLGEEAPPQPEEVELNPADEGTTVFGTVPRHRDVELPDEPVFGYPRPVATAPTTTGNIRVGMWDREVSDEEIDGEPIGGAQVEYLDGATNGSALALAFNGEVFLFDPQMAAALKGMVDKAITGMAL